MKLYPLLSLISFTSSLFAGAAVAQSEIKQVAIPGVIAADARVELVKDGYQWLEGPVDDGKGGLYFTDLSASRIYRLAPTGEIAIWRENTQGTNGLFVMPDGRLLGSQGRGKKIVEFMADQSVRPLAAAFEGKPLYGPNDLIPDKKGGIYFTDPPPRLGPDLAPKEPGNLYYMRPNGDVIFLDGAIQRPNGITLSLDERTLYVADTEGEFLWAFDVQPDGTVKNRRRFAKMLEPEKGQFGLKSRGDGIAIDAEGRVYVTTGAGIQVISPKGEHLGIIRIPALAHNVAFAGPKKQTLYLTGQGGLYRVELLAAGPAGRSK